MYRDSNEKQRFILWNISRSVTTPMRGTGAPHPVGSVGTPGRLHRLGIATHRACKSKVDLVAVAMSNVLRWSSITALLWKKICAIAFLIFCVVFHISAFAVFTNSFLIPLCGWIVFLSATVLTMISFRRDKHVFYWSVFSALFCGVFYLVANMLTLPAFTLLLCLCFPLLAIQLGLCVTSLRMLKNLRYKENLTEGFLTSASILQLFVASSVIAAALVLLRNLPLFYIFSPAWVSYAIFTVNLALIATRVTAILESENTGVHASSVDCHRSSP